MIELVTGTWNAGHTIDQEAVHWLAYQRPHPEDMELISSVSGIDKIKQEQQAVLEFLRNPTPKRQVATLRPVSRTSARPSQAWSPPEPQSNRLTKFSDYQLGPGWMWRSSGVAADADLSYEIMLNPPLSQTFNVVAALTQGIERETLAASVAVYDRLPENKHRVYSLVHKEGTMSNVGIVLRTDSVHADLTLSATQRLVEESRYFTDRSNVRHAHPVSDGVAIAERNAHVGTTHERGLLISRVASRTRKELGIKRHGNPPTLEQTMQIPRVFQEHWLVVAGVAGIDVQNMAWRSTG